MYPVIPADSYAQAIEMACCFFAVLAALASYILTMRF